ncbi:MAG: peptidoglycan bridge formation glycyltransferase FemA/FemB family protein [Coriobacteriia bacterium]|nr:peptidoglycan bridge formation glycyltransferase FemA/FemB family protein [Coriobacteriia bacterium]MCL2750538.1 peptidoglycan bridge formation glycyltransferase FemA/FemB family protein [Coriobacteriia bacterium]
MTSTELESFDPVSFYLARKHFLQTEPWGEFQRAYGNETVSRSGTASDGGTWEYLAIVERGRFSSRLYCPYGPFSTTKEALREALDSLKKESRSYLVDFARVEPRGSFNAEDLKEMGLRPAARNVQPPDTIVNDVRANAVSEEDILLRGSTTRRQLYRYSLRDGVEYKTSYNPADIKYFLEMIHEVAKRTGITPHEDAYFETLAQTLFPQKAAGMLLSVLDDMPIATLIFYTDGTTAAYAHAGSVDGYKKISPPSGLFMHLQFFARESGHTLLDTYGVAPEGAGKEHDWAGFTQFKESFGGVRVHCPGTWELPVNKLRYTLYNLVGRIVEK